MQVITSQFLSNTCSRSSVLQYLLVNNVTSNKNICMCSFRKNYLICIPRERKPFCQLRQLGGFVGSHYENHFLHEKEWPLSQDLFEHFKGRKSQ